MSGVAAVVVLGVCSLICLLDCQCRLQYVGSTFPNSFNGICTPTATARRSYVERLERWRSRVDEYLGNVTLASLELDGDGSALCRLAHASVHERNRAKLEAHTQMSRLAHVLFLLRDYARFDLGHFAFSGTPEFWFTRKRAQLLSENQYRFAEPADDDVWLTVAEAATHTNPDFDAYANDMERLNVNYATETGIMYSGLIVGTVCFALLADRWGAFATKRFTGYQRKLCSLQPHHEQSAYERLFAFIARHNQQDLFLPPAPSIPPLKLLGSLVQSSDDISYAEPGVYHWKPDFSPRGSDNDPIDNPIEDTLTENVTADVRGDALADALPGSPRPSCRGPPLAMGARDSVASSLDESVW